MKTVVIATPHKRNNFLELQLARRMPGYRIARISKREDLNFAYLKNIHPEWIFFPHWSWIIPEEVHTRYDCVVFHMTDLPYGRGGSPLQNLIVRGHKETWLTALKCESGLDSGPIYRKRRLSLDGSAEEILHRAAVLMESLIVDIVESHPTPIPQEGEVVEFKRRRPQDGDIASLSNLEQVYDFIRMLDAEGYPPAFLQTEHMQFEFSEAVKDEEWVDAKVRIRRRIHG